MKPTTVPAELPEALRLADALRKLDGAKKYHPSGPCGQMLGCEQYRLVASWLTFETLQSAAEELRRLHAENETLRTGYSAARLEIESLKAQGAQQPGTAYAALMQAASDWICENVPIGTCGATAWATKLQNVANALRAPHGQAPAAQQAGEQPLPLLVRDIAADLATTPIQVCMALSALGFGGHSVNMVITPTMAKALRAHFSAMAQPAPQQDVSAAGGDSFLLLPTRPTPDAPANTAGLSWDAYSGAQMLAYGRSCSDAAKAAIHARAAQEGKSHDNT